jgi:hypothetical protein
MGFLLPAGIIMRRGTIFFRNRYKSGRSGVFQFGHRNTSLKMSFELIGVSTIERQGAVSHGIQEKKIMQK